MKKITLEVYDAQKHKGNVDDLVLNLRTADRMEARAIGYDSLYEGIYTSLNCADMAFIARGKQGETLCTFGISAIAHREYGNSVWFLATTDMDKYQREFVYYSKIIVKEWLTTHERLYNYISAKNDKSIRWLKRLGAKFSEPFLINGEEFLLFILDR